MIFQLLRLWWYCWKNDIMFKCETFKYDPSYYEICIGEFIKNNIGLKWEHKRMIRIVVSKHPCRKPYQIYNRIRFLIYNKIIKHKKPIKAYYHDFGMDNYAFTTFC